MCCIVINCNTKYVLLSLWKDGNIWYKSSAGSDSEYVS